MFGSSRRGGSSRSAASSLRSGGSAHGGSNRDDAVSTAGNVDLSALTTASTRFSTVRSERRSSTDDAAVATIAAEDAERSRARVGFHAAPGQAWG